MPGDGWFEADNLFLYVQILPQCISHFRLVINLLRKKADNFNDRENATRRRNTVGELSDVLPQLFAHSQTNHTEGGIPMWDRLVYRPIRKQYTNLKHFEPIRRKVILPIHFGPQTNQMDGDFTNFINFVSWTNQKMKHQLGTIWLIDQSEGDISSCQARLITLR